MSCRIWTGSLAVFLLAGCLLLYIPWQMVLFAFALGGILLGYAAFKRCVYSNYDSSYSHQSVTIDFAEAKANEKGKIYQFPTVTKKAGNRE